MLLSWMAWTWPTIMFFVFIVTALSTMVIWEYFKPGGSPRKGILGLETTRGDRLFISLLGSGFIHIIWLGVTDTTLWGAVVVSVLYLVGVFKWV
ncbi:MAG: DUF2160 domain-containing protein [SAR324 cluster bacterium]|nr:DUF2160 domain-containing protein [SAR324 cluster bacterium]MDP7335526.1 DUF2160 domain-containing protein [SAR324 cluster bacterium]MDP7500892.1 DUF2160 domain-containing protein [SAR324 cluster bacterium]HJM95050.1 DUF2160 domain-containing protein [Candidatus Neomarinimicrobiota bacterium]